VELEQLRKYVATLEEKVQNAEVEKNEWKAKAKSLAGNFMGTLKDLRSSLYVIKRDQQEQMKEIRTEFDNQLQVIVN